MVPTKNPFVAIKSETSNNQAYAPQQDENGVWPEWWYFEDVTDDEYLKDTRHFTITERDAIIKAFYEANTAAKRDALKKPLDCTSKGFCFYSSSESVLINCCY